MSMNFDSLPNERPAGNVIEDKYCRAKIKDAKAATGTGEKTKGVPCLNLTFDCTSFDGSITTKIWDTLYESDKPLLRYKVRQFILALGLKLQGEFTMADLAKIIIGKDLILAVKTEQNGNYPKRNVIDAYEDSIYYPLSAKAQLLGLTEEPDGTPAPAASTTFNAADAEPDDDGTPFDTNTPSASMGAENY